MCMCMCMCVCFLLAAPGHVSAVYPPLTRRTQRDARGTEGLIVKSMQAEEVQRLMSVFGLSPRGMWHPDVSDGMEAVPWFFAGSQLLGPDVKRTARPTVGGSTLSSSRAAARSSEYQYTHRMSRSRGKPYDKTMAKPAVED